MYRLIFIYRLKKVYILFVNKLDKKYGADRPKTQSNLI